MATGNMEKMQKKPRTVSYLRVSTVSQDTEKNKTAVRAYANSKDFGRVEFTEEKISGIVPFLTSFAALKHP